MGNVNFTELSMSLPACIGGSRKGSFAQVSSGDLTSSGDKRHSRTLEYLEIENMYKNIGPDSIEDRHGKVHRDDDMLIILIEWAILKIEYAMKTIQEDAHMMMHKLQKQLLINSNERKAARVKSTIIFPKVPTRPPGTREDDDTVVLIKNDESDELTEESIPPPPPPLLDGSHKNETGYLRDNIDVITDRKKEILHSLSTMMVSLSHLKTEIQLCKLEKTLTPQRFVDFRRSIDANTSVDPRLYDKEYVINLSETLIFLTKSVTKSIQNRPTQ
jgi:hypothetical protein